MLTFESCSSSLSQTVVGGMPCVPSGCQFWWCTGTSHTYPPKCADPHSARCLGLMGGFLKRILCLCLIGNWGPHLVIVRSCSTLRWELELKRWCPGLKTLLYVGSHRELRAKRQVFYCKYKIKLKRKLLNSCRR